MLWEDSNLIKVKIAGIDADELTKVLNGDVIRKAVEYIAFQLHEYLFPDSLSKKDGVKWMNLAWDSHFKP